MSSSSANSRSNRFSSFSNSNPVNRRSEGADMRRCRCGLLLYEGVANTPRNFGRRYSSCPRWTPQRDNGDCGYFRFHDQRHRSEMGYTVLNDEYQSDLLRMHMELEESRLVVDELEKKLQDCTRKVVLFFIIVGIFIMYLAY